MEATRPPDGQPPATLALEPVWYETLVLHASDAIVGVDTEQRIRVWNHAAAEMFGYAEEEIVGCRLSTLIPEDRQQAHSESFRSFEQGTRDRRAMGHGTELFGRRRGGESFPVEIAISRIPLVDGVLLMACVRDMTDRRGTEQKLARRVAELDSVMRAIPDSVCRLKADGTFVDVSRGSGDGIFLTSEVTGQNITAVLPRKAALQCMRTIREVIRADTIATIMLRESDWVEGGSRSFEANVAKYGDDEVIAVIRDVTQREQAVSRLAHSATHDDLTGLANRPLICRRIEEALRRSAQDGTTVAVFMLDLDHFKTVNDRLGHDAGDLLLRAVANRLVSAARESDTVGRFGGDEFVVLTEGLADPREAISVAQRISTALQTPLWPDDIESRVTASMGYAVSSRGEQDGAAILRHADLALYRAKSLGRDRAEAFDQSLQAAFERRSEIEAWLRRAVDNDEITIFYQPVMEVASRRVAGVEALLRWDRPGAPPISPEEFIPIAEDTGLILRIGEWVLHEACAQAAKWADHFAPAFKVAVNVSARQLVEPGLADTVARAISAAGIDPHSLSVEITETVLIDRLEVAITNLEKIRALGVTISLDDFGTGYASLSYLRDLPITHIKIDRSFIAGLVIDPQNTTIIESTIALAHDLGLSVIAEGVETARQFELLEEFGCDEAQGFHLGRPQTAAAIEQMWSASDSTTRQDPTADTKS